MKHYLLALAAAAACLVFTGTYAQNTPQDSGYREAKVRDNAFIKTPVPAWVTPTTIPDTKLTGPVVMLLSETHFQVDKTSQYFIHKALKFNNANVLSEFGQMPIEFAPEYQTLLLHSLRIIRNGQSIDKRDTSSVRFLQREMGLEQGVYSGMVTASILIDDLRVGDVVEVAYTLAGANPVFGNNYFEAASWSQQYPTELRRVVLEYPSNRNIQYKFISSNPLAPTPKPVQTRHGNIVRLKFDYPQAPATLVDTNVPNNYDLAAWIQFSEFGSWNEVAVWASNLFAEPTPMTGEFAQLISRLQEESDTEKKIVKALQYVQNEIRYFSVALGESSHRPAAPNITIQRRFGDCKDKSFLLVSLLRKLGITADPVLVSAQRRNNIQVMLPSPLDFDHAIVRVQYNGKYYFVDPTRLSQAGHLETMGQELADTEVLVITPKTTALTIIPDTQTLANQPTNILHETMTVTDYDKPAKLDSHLLMTGRDAEYHRHISRRYPEQYAKFMVTELTKRYPGAHRIGEQEFKDSPEDNRFEIIEHYMIDNPGEVEGNSWRISYSPTNMSGVLKRPDLIDRPSPFLLSLYPLRMQYSFDITLPGNVKAALEPTKRQVSDSYFDFQVNNTFKDNIAHVDMDLRILRTAVQVADMKDYAKDQRDANNMSAAYVSIPLRLTKPAPAESTSNASYGSRLHAKLEEEIKSYSKVINDGKLTGRDLALVYLSRAMNYANTDRLSAAIPDINEAIKLDSTNMDIRREAGIMFRNHGDYESSLEQLNKALTYGADPEVIYGNRGEVYYYMGKYDYALSEFGRIISATKPGPTIVYAMIWYLRTLNHAGKPVPQFLKDLAIKAEGSWPRQAIGLFAGTTTPEKALEMANRLEGDKHEMALCEAYFYIGDYYLLQKDNEKAAEYFRKSRATGVTHFEEYTAAGIELARMGRK